MNQSIILGIGAGRCGIASLAKILNQQPDAVCSCDEPPFLSWERIDGQEVLQERLARWHPNSKVCLGKEVAFGGLPYLEDAIATEPEIYIVGWKYPREEVVASFCRWLNQAMPPADQSLYTIVRVQQHSRSEHYTVLPSLQETEPGDILRIDDFRQGRHTPFNHAARPRKY